MLDAYQKELLAPPGLRLFSIKVLFNACAGFDNLGYILSYLFQETSIAMLFFKKIL